jgi:hypothetical protein
MTSTNEFEMVEGNSTTDFERNRDGLARIEKLHVLYPQKQEKQEQLEIGSPNATITSESLIIEKICEKTGSIEPTLPILPLQQQLEGTSQNTFTSSPLVITEKISEAEGGMTHSGTYIMLTLFTGTLHSV